VSSGRGGRCNPCHAGTYSDSFRTSCESCISGTFSSPVSSTCLNCTMGNFSNSIACLGCPVGKYSPSNRESACTVCVAGTFSAQNYSSSCVDCTSGKFIGHNASTICYSCSLGMFANSSHSSSCSKCERGRYQHISGSTFCVPCQAGKYLEYDGTTSARLCFPCSYGKTSKEGAEFCSDSQHIATTGGTKSTVVGKFTAAGVAGGLVFFGLLCYCCFKWRIKKKKARNDLHHLQLMSIREEENKDLEDEVKKLESTIEKKRLRDQVSAIFCTRFSDMP